MEDNRLYNLQIVTQQANCKKSAKKRDYTFAANNFQNRKCVKINQTTQGVVYFNSMYAIQQHLGINAGIVKMVCEGLNNCKTGISKKDGHHYINLSMYGRKICLMTINIQPISAQERWLMRIKRDAKWKCLK